MAEIEIRKKRKAIWPWVIGILAVLVIIAWLVFKNQDVNKSANGISHGKALAVETLVLRKMPVFPQTVPIKLEAYLA